MRSVREVLRERLSPADYQRLEELTQGWQEIPFEYYPDCNAFQTSDEWELSHSHLGEEDLQLLLRACEVLSQLGEAVDIPVYRDQAPEWFTQDFIFDDGNSRDSTVVGAKFIALLAKNPAYRVEAREFPGGLHVQVTFSYRSELEFSREHNNVRLLLESARNVVQRCFFGGYRL